MALYMHIFSLTFAGGDLISIAYCHFFHLVYFRVTLACTLEAPSGVNFDVILWRKIKNYLYIEPRRKKTGLGIFRPGQTQTRLYSHGRWLEAGNFEFRKKRDCSTCVAKTKSLISCAVTAHLICVCVFPHAKSQFFHDAAHI